MDNRFKKEMCEGRLSYISHNKETTTMFCYGQQYEIFSLSQNIYSFPNTLLPRTKILSNNANNKLHILEEIK
jgi:hypothetical protein